ncbi:SapC [Roseibium album]|nr:SapC [Roseibium album]
MMTKQLMIYQRAVPISNERHRDWSVKTGGNFGYASGINSVPLVAAEFVAAATEFAIVFAGEDENIFPTVILGMRDGENAYVNEEGAWSGGYVPAFLRRYPFVFMRSEDQQTFTLCIDEEFDGFNKEGKGERLFDAEGERTQYLQSMLNFVTEFQSQHNRTSLFVKRLIELGLLEPAQARFQLPGGDAAALGGFKTISRDKLRALPGETLSEMAKTDELELCYVHLQSLNNLTPMAQRQAETPQETEIEKAPAAEKKPSSAKGKGKN